MLGKIISILSLIYDRRNIISYRYDIDEDGTIIREETKDFPMLPILGISAQF